MARYQWIGELLIMLAVLSTAAAGRDGQATSSPLADTAATKAAAAEEAAADRTPPSWTQRRAWKEGTSEYVVVRSGLWATADEAILDAANEARRVVHRYVAADRPGVPTSAISVSDVRSDFVTDLYVEPVPRDYGIMHRAYLLVRLDPQQRFFMLRRIETERHHRLMLRMTALVAVLVFAGICLLLYVRLDDLTLGYFRLQIRLATLLLFLLVSGLVCWLSGWFELLVGNS